MAFSHTWMGKELIELPGSVLQLSRWVTANLTSHDDNDPLHYYPALQFRVLSPTLLYCEAVLGDAYMFLQFLT